MTNSLQFLLGLDDYFGYYRSDSWRTELEYRPSRCDNLYLSLALHDQHDRSTTRSTNFTLLNRDDYGRTPRCCALAYWTPASVPCLPSAPSGRSTTDPTKATATWGFSGSTTSRPSRSNSSASGVWRAEAWDWFCLAPTGAPGSTTALVCQQLYMNSEVQSDSPSSGIHPGSPGHSTMKRGLPADLPPVPGRRDPPAGPFRLERGCQHRPLRF